jgi:hypothetical protein
MTTLHLRVCSVALLCLVAGAWLRSQTPPAAQQPGMRFQIELPQPTTAAGAKFIRITQTGSAGNGEQWAIAQVRVYQATR